MVASECDRSNFLDRSEAPLRPLELPMYVHQIIIREGSS